MICFTDFNIIFHNIGPFTNQNGSVAGLGVLLGFTRLDAFENVKWPIGNGQ
jgi:hypothetical protein